MSALPDIFDVLLRHGDVENRYDGDGSRIVGAIVLTAVNVGMRREEVRKMLDDPQNKGGFAAFRRRRNLDGWFDREWRRAVERARSHPAIEHRHEATVVATELIDRAGELPWPGVGGSTDHEVYVYALGIAARAGRLGQLALAVRSVGVGVGVDHTTAGRSLQRLVKRGLLRRIAAGRGHAASQFEVESDLSALVGAPQSPPRDGALVGAPQWSETSAEGDVEQGALVSAPQSQRSQVPHSGSVEGASSARRCPTPSHTYASTESLSVGRVWGTYERSDIWRWRGLGLTTKRVWDDLDLDEAIPTKTLAGALGMGQSTARRHLARLVDHGLAVRTEDGYLRSALDPADLEEELGVAGLTEAQREHHELERKLREEARAAQHAPFSVDPETGEVIGDDDLLVEQPPEHQAIDDAWPHGPCRRCGRRTGLDDFHGGWLCSRCEPFLDGGRE